MEGWRKEGRKTERHRFLTLEITPPHPPPFTPVPCPCPQRLPDGALYCGHLAGGRRHGVGSCRWPDGSEYHGAFEASLSLSLSLSLE